MMYCNISRLAWPSSCPSATQILRGISFEPAGAAAYAGLVKAVDQGLVSPDERIVVINTGNGLKDVAGAMKGTTLVGTKAQPVKPDLADLERVMADLNQN